MQETLVQKETAILARDKGFDWSTSVGLSKHDNLMSKVSITNDGPKNYWDKKDTDLRMQTQSQLQKWIRDVHNIHIEVWINTHMKRWDCSIYYINSNPEEEALDIIIGADTYEEVLEKGLIESLKLIK